MKRPKNVQEHVNAMLLREHYNFGGRFGAEFAIRGLDGPCSKVGEGYPTEQEANQHESYLREILGKELARSESRGRASAYRDAAEKVKAIVGDLKIVAELQALAEQADALDHITITCEEGVPEAELARIVAASEEDYGKGRVKVVRWKAPNGSALKTRYDYLAEIRNQLNIDVVEVPPGAMPPGMIALVQDGEIKAVGNVGDLDTDSGL